ncbi:MAG: amidohydrolase family protein [Deltaproteobacteria bacterium]|nr:amidohydrolase family protein [Deltaproteobacteria bacterium]
MVWLALAVGACGSAPPPAAESPRRPTPEVALPPLPWLAERRIAGPPRSPMVALRGGTVMTAAGAIIPRGVVLMHNGRIEAVGPVDDTQVPEGAIVVDTTGRFVTPGIIDAHSHMGVYASPGLVATDDGNEATSPVTAQISAEDAFWPQDPQLQRALRAGVTSILVLPGSANLVGGRGVVFKLHLGRSADEMRFPGAPDSLKIACGENPRRVYGVEREAFPSTRMGNLAGYRASFQQAVEYGRSWRTWQHTWRLWRQKRIKYERDLREHRAARRRAQSGAAATATADGGAETPTEPEDPGPEPAPPARDFGLETLLGAIEGRVLVQNHCYRAEEMVRMMRLGRELGFGIRAFHHAVEAYKIRDLLAEADVGIATWVDWWGFKLEAYDAIPENLALLTEAGVRAVLHSDSAMLVQRLNQEAGKGMRYGRDAGIPITEDQALRWITANPAWAIGVDQQTGSIEPGKMADVVVWSQSPFSVYARADLVFVDGLLAWDRHTPGSLPPTDFEVGQGSNPGGAR